MKLKRLSRENGLWNELWKDWDRQCTEFQEEFSDFAPSSLITLKDLAEEPERPTAGVFGLHDGNEFKALCQLNVAFLPKYTGRVLRLRHLVLSPRFDFSPDIDVEEYTKVLTSTFAQTVMLTKTEMPAQHVKLHFRSPADREFFKTFKRDIEATGAFASVQMQGAWLYIS